MVDDLLKAATYVDDKGNSCDEFSEVVVTDGTKIYDIIGVYPSTSGKTLWIDVEKRAELPVSSK